ncbi:GntR family transcriptional regulator [Massilia sp. Mn16-1_5]|nr:GntR family transcriptional regulator [Massilia sp. Mn16-1_5]
MPTDPDHPDASRAQSITLKDVARLAGLSPITVSRALHNPKLVKPETIERVKEAAASIGYIPNMLAGSLASKRSRLIAAVVPQLFNSMFAETVQALGDELAAHGYQLLLSVSNYSAQNEEEAVSAILSRQPDGVVLTGISHLQSVRKKLLASRVPVVETWDLTPTPLDMLVGFSHTDIGETIGRYLLDKGYRRFGLVWANDERAAVRRKGLEAALRRAGLPPPPAHMVPVPANLALGRQGLRALLERHPDLDVIVCSSDALAQGVLTEASVRGIAVPGQLGIMGFGDFDFAGHTSPPISSVYVDKRAIGIQAARALLARIEGRPLEDNIIDVGFSLMERESTARPSPSA